MPDPSHRIAAFLRRGFAMLTVAMLAAVPNLSLADERSGTMLVRVTSADGTPIARAHVTLVAAGHSRSIAVGASGRATIAGLAPGTYALSAIAPDYQPLAPHPISIRSGAPTEIALTLSRSASSLVTIGSVDASGSTTVSTSTAPTQTLHTQAYAVRGFTRVSDVLADALSATVIRQGSGSAAAPESVALRGPDPTETLVDIDGHEINGGGTGDFDLSLLDPSDFESVQVVYGIAPSALVGPSTIGGAINVRTLEPTTIPHGLVRLSGGSYDSFAQTLQASGTDGALGYVLSLHRANTANDVSQQTITDASGNRTVVGSDVDAATSLAKLRYAFGPARSGYAQVTIRDQSVVRDLSAALSSLVAPGTYAMSPDSRLLDHNAGYALDVEVPLDREPATGAARTTALFRHLSSYASRSVEGAASGLTSTYFDDRDRIDDDTLELDWSSPKLSLALKYRLRGERLDTFDPSLATNVVDQSVGLHPLGSLRKLDATSATDASSIVRGLAQTQASLAVRVAYDPTAQFHYTLAAYESAFSSFGHSFDPRAGIVYTPSSRTAIRASAGTTFQAPQLTELYIPAALPAPDANGHIAIGNPNLRADHATEYDLGFEQLFGERSRPLRASIDVYRTNLRTPAQSLLPTATCAAGAPNLACATYPVNIGGAVYTGAEFRLERALGGGSALRLGYAIASTYASSAPDAVQNGSIVPFEQFLGVPLHKATLDFEHRASTGIFYDTTLLYEGRYNEVNRAPFATLRATVGATLGRIDVTLNGTNLTNADASRFTQAGAGIPYGGTDGPIATDAYALPGRAVTLSLARHF